MGNGRTCAWGQMPGLNSAWSPRHSDAHDFSLKVKEAFKRTRQYNSGVIIHFPAKLAIPIMRGKWEKTNFCVLSAGYTGGFRL